MGQTLVVAENKLLFWAIAFILRKRQLLTKAKQRKVKTHVHVEYFWYLCNSWLLAQPKFICAEHTVFQRFMLISSSRIPGIFPRLTSLSAKVISKLSFEHQFYFAKCYNQFRWMLVIFWPSQVGAEIWFMIVLSLPH